MDASLYTEMKNSFDLIMENVFPIICSIITLVMILCLLNNIKNLFMYYDYGYSPSVTGYDDEDSEKDIEELSEEIPEQEHIEHKEKQKEKIRSGGVCPYCYGVLTRVYGKKGKLKYIHCEYCGQVVDVK